jgi:hypothetical protein
MTLPAAILKAYAAAPWVAIGGALTGLADVLFFHGAIGVTMSNWLPWTAAYGCQPRP